MSENNPNLPNNIGDTVSNMQVQAQTQAVVLQPEGTQNIIQKTAQFMDEGGIFMWVIFAIWCFGVAISFERFKRLFSYDIDGSALMSIVKKSILANEVQKAIQTCSNSNALLAHVLKSGLKRANQNKEQIRDAIESTILEVVPKTEKRLGHLALIANLSTLFGLLGTIQGLIQSFAAVANADPASKSKLLALGIAVAMNTTALGLLAAISLMIAHSILVAKSEKIVSEIDEYSTKLVDILGTKQVHIKQSNDEEKAA